MHAMTDEAELYRRRYAEMAAARGSRRRPNVKDVAAIANVAVGTASDALNRKGRVNPATRDRIRTVAEAIGYFPSATARSLKRSRNGVIGLCIRPFGGAPLQYIAVSYYARFLNAAAVAALERKYALAILPPDISTELDNIALDGVIVTDPPPGDPLIEELRNRSIPYVTDLGEVDNPNSLCVGNDQAQAVRTVCDHFKSQGAKTVALLVADGDEDYTVRSLRGYRQWCDENGQEGRVERTNILDAASTAAAAKRLMSGADRPDAIYTTEAPVGNYLVNAARAARLKTPDDLLLAYCAEHTMDPTLADVTMLSLHAEEIAQAAVDLLASTLDGQDPSPRHRIIQTTLHVRDSSQRRSPARISRRRKAGATKG
jgi:DNA-binding LacI/PurR family transcriptional regulator